MNTLGVVQVFFGNPNKIVLVQGSFKVKASRDLLKALEKESPNNFS